MRELHTNRSLTFQSTRRNFGRAFGLALFLPAAGTSRPRRRWVHGRVTDESGLPLKGATVQLKELATLRVRTYVAQRGGAYRFRNLATNVNYELRAGYSGVWCEKVKLDRFDAREEAQIDLVIPLGLQRT